MNSQTFFVRIKTASPVHIGSDEVYEPTGFVLDEKDKTLVSFDPYNFISKLDGDSVKEFSAICQKGTLMSLVEVYRFVNRNKHLADGHRVRVSDDFVSHFQKTMKLTREKEIQQEFNRYQIARTAFNPLDNKPYIPGSAIKGSIRTAILNFRNKGNKNPPFKGNRGAKDLETHLTGGIFHKDPFRLIKVSDFMAIGEVKRCIVYGVNKKKRPSEREAQGPPQIFEIIEPGAEFIGSIIVQSAEHTEIKKPVTMDEIGKALAGFFGEEKKREDSELTFIGATPSAFNLPAQAKPLRIGRHSGAECLTVNGHRDIKIMQAKGKKPIFKDHATTLWLAAQSKNPTTNKLLRPFGWVLLETLSPAELKETQRVADEATIKKEKERQRTMALKQEQEAERQAEQAAEQEKQLKRQQEEETTRKREERLKNQWEAMSEEERDLAIVRQEEFALLNAGHVDPLQSIWPKIDSAEPEYQKALAAAFMKLWQEQKKWDVKPKKKKQYAKVQQVKEILGIS